MKHKIVFLACLFFLGFSFFATAGTAELLPASAPTPLQSIPTLGPNSLSPTLGNLPSPPVLRDANGNPIPPSTPTNQATPTPTRTATPTPSPTASPSPTPADPSFYNSPWLPWIIAGILLLIVVFLLGRNTRKD